MGSIVQTKKQKTKKRLLAFTLIEMLIVIVILAILVVALIPKLNQVYSRARDVARKAHLKQIASAVGVYKVDYGSLTGLDLISWTRDLAPPLISGGYLTSMPIDPDNTRSRSGVTFIGQVRPASGGTYGFAAVMRDGSLNTFVLMAKVEQLTNANRTYNDVTTFGRIAPGMGWTTFVPQCTSVTINPLAIPTGTTLVQGGACMITQPSLDQDKDTNQRFLYAE